MTFHVGQKVVCIRGCATPGWLLIKGDIYTIASAGFFEGRRFYDVAEARSERAHPHAWCGDRFRPLIERETDISIFTSILKTEHQKEPA